MMTNFGEIQVNTESFEDDHMRAAITRRTLSASEAIDEVDSPVDGLEDGSLTITSQTTGNVTDIWRRTTAITRRPLPEDGTVIVRFEIPYAHVMPPANEKENSTIKKYVVYDLNIRQDSVRNTDPNPVTIERRYTDFLNLFDCLRSEYPALMNNVPFPKKAFIGNFSSALIAERSASFEAFLDHIISFPDLRDSSSFLKFLRDNELTKACRLLDERRNEVAIPILEDCFRLLNKIFMDRSKAVLLLLCRLVAACTTSPIPHPSAEKWAELALRRYDGVSDADLLTLYIQRHFILHYIYFGLFSIGNLIIGRHKLATALKNIYSNQIICSLVYTLYEIEVISC